METIKIRNGSTVLAVKDKRFGIRAKQFVNDTQANVQVMILHAQGINCHVIGFGTPVKFIKIN